MSDPQTGLTTSTIVDAVARILAEATGGDNHVFAAGVTLDVTTNEPLVVPLADDFSESGMPAATVALGDWSPVLGGGIERLTMTIQCAIWRDRGDLGATAVELYADRDKLADAFGAHAKAYLHEPSTQSVILQGGPGIRQRSLPKVGPNGETRDRLFLTLPFTVEAKLDRRLVPQPA